MTIGFESLLEDIDNLNEKEEQEIINRIHKNREERANIKLNIAIEEFRKAWREIENLGKDIRYPNPNYDSDDEDIILEFNDIEIY